ncbi:MAG: hypothetical protein ACOCX1_01360 [Fimbriimonadaceae bacterium]
MPDEPKPDQPEEQKPEEASDEERFNRSIDQASEAARRDWTEKEADMERRLAEFSQRSQSVGSKYRARQARETEERRSTQESSKGLGVGLTVAYVIIGVPLVGFGVGFLIDRATGSEIWGSTLGLLGAFAGVALTIYIVNRSNQQG